MNRKSSRPSFCFKVANPIAGALRDCTSIGHCLILALCLSSWAPCVLAQVSSPSSGDTSPLNAATTQEGGKPTHGEAEAFSASTVSRPAPFGGSWDSRLKLTGDWGGIREDL